jgi:predicted small secreted protein
MNALKLVSAGVIFLFSCNTMQAQFGKRLGKAIENAAKNTTVRKAVQKTGEWNL